ncbi:MAG TPA: alpha/beta fold hydrolase [Steroidobacteraceae bacterium]|nr:alpha/beta fold hydrolase [Steroidobacteraceae bacterium]
MTENAYFLPVGGERLFAFLHLPDGKPRAAALLCAPLAEEKLWSHRVFVSFARELAGRGWAVLRFDFRGEGDSDRRFEESDLGTRLEDTAAAIDELKRRAGLSKVALLGLRLGAMIAAAAAAQRDDVERLVLWDPVVDGADYMQSVLRMNLMAQMAIHRKVVEDRDALVARLQRGEGVNVEGYELRLPLFEQVSGLKLGDLLAASGVSCQLVSISQKPAPVRDELMALSSQLPRLALDSVAEEPFWREIRAFYRGAQRLFRSSLDWLGTAA